MALVSTYENHLVNDAGTPIVGATVNAYRVDTGALAATTTTQGATAGPPPKRAGYWKIGPLDDALEYYIEAVVGAEKVVMGRWSGEMGTLKVFDRATLPALTTIGGATPVTSGNIAAQSVANAAALGGVAAAGYSQTSHNHAAAYSPLGHTHAYAQMATGRYTGDFSTNRLIAVGFTPKHVIVQSDAASLVWGRGEMWNVPGVGIQSLLIGSDGAGNLIHGLPYTAHFLIDTNGFRVQVSGVPSIWTLNDSSVGYTWTAWA